MGDNIDLTENDIEGASLNGREPKELRIQELQFWLACRAVNYKKLKTKAELVTRVHKTIQDGEADHIIDPTPDQLHVKRKASVVCPGPDGAVPAPCPDTSKSPTIVCPKDGWTKALKKMPTFNDVNIEKYSRKSAKEALEAESVAPVKPKSLTKTAIKAETKGYLFYREGFLHDIWAVNTPNRFYLKAKCFRSLRKNDDPHSLWMCVSTIAPHDVKEARCSCTAGASGFCNHVFALLYMFSHYNRSKFTNIPDDLSKTSMPQSWHKPRMEGISSEPVMECMIKKPKLDSGPKAGMSCSLYEARQVDTIANRPVLLESVQANLKKVNPNFGICYMAKTEGPRTEYVRTSIGTYVPKGSVLSHQLALSEGNFDVSVNQITLDQHKCNIGCTDLDYPELPLGSTHDVCFDDDLSPDAKAFLLGLKKTKGECVHIESNTRDQSSSDLWWTERCCRITASNFGEICKRKKQNCDKLLERLLKKPEMDAKLPVSLKHGRQYEHVAARKYGKYMCNIGHQVDVLSSGLVLNPSKPFLGCSPDCRVTDPYCHPHYGLAEIKCPYKVRGITPLQAAQTDSDFCCSVINNDVVLKRDHVYYLQVQGQMAVTGARWCDFVVYTFKGMSIERIYFDEHFWEEKEKKLHEFFFKHMLHILVDRFKAK